MRRGHGPSVRPRRGPSPEWARRWEGQTSYSSLRRTLGDDHAQLAGGSADIAHTPIPGELEPLGERTSGVERDPRHRMHELLEPRGIAVELGEHGGAAVLELVLGPAGLESLGEIGPESVEPTIEHLQQTTDVGRLVGIEKLRAVHGVSITRARSVAVAVQESQRDKPVQEVVYGARVQSEPLANLFAGQRAIGQHGEQSQLHRRQQCLRRPESHADFQDARRIQLTDRHDFLPWHPPCLRRSYEAARQRHSGSPNRSEGKLTTQRTPPRPLGRVDKGRVEMQRTWTKSK